jgi:hypothetical protein
MRKMDRNTKIVLAIATITVFLTVFFGYMALNAWNNYKTASYNISNGIWHSMFPDQILAAYFHTFTQSLIPLIIVWTVSAVILVIVSAKKAKLKLSSIFLIALVICFVSATIHTTNAQQIGNYYDRVQANCTGTSYWFVNGTVTPGGYCPLQYTSYQTPKDDFNLYEIGAQSDGYDVVAGGCQYEWGRWNYYIEYMINDQYGEVFGPALNNSTTFCVTIMSLYFSTHTDWTCKLVTPSYWLSGGMMSNADIIMSYSSEGPPLMVHQLWAGSETPNSTNVVYAHFSNMIAWAYFPGWSGYWMQESGINYSFSQDAPYTLSINKAYYDFDVTTHAYTDQPSSDTTYNDVNVCLSMSGAAVIIDDSWIIHISLNELLAEIRSNQTILH